MSNESVEVPDGPSDGDVLQAVNQTGFLLERQVHSALLSHGFRAFVGVAYSDPQTETHREMDVVGILSERVQGRIPVFMHVLIECKKWSSGPLVGVGGTPTKAERYRPPRELRFAPFDPVRDATHGQLEGFSSHNFYHYYGLHNAPQPLAFAEMLATQLVLMERKQTWLAKNTSVYDSIVLPLVKAQSKYSSVARDLDPNEPGDFAVSFTRSALVTTAPLRGVLWINDENTEVTHPHYFPVVRNFSAEGMPDTFTFEVVSADHLDAWLSTQVVPFFRAVCEAVDEWLRDPLEPGRGPTR
ncbi:hypothetical protein [Kribbella sp. VKM Ac-2566]|uniref:hypothetical protein n=1 Tax=Kribbella sp. VKM Ac-2566 TaxID=2512218 RepID=UPI00106385A6|nr:hypothetical protein [Kribbella sp. VKM Ac-2566]TDW88794.1 hypothetical protein EV647_5804 [Kribbella sp. VKM Ac-2566]